MHTIFMQDVLQFVINILLIIFSCICMCTNIMVCKTLWSANKCLTTISNWKSLQLGKVVDKGSTSWSQFIINEIF